MRIIRLLPRKHELDHTDHTDQESIYISALKRLSHLLVVGMIWR